MPGPSRPARFLGYFARHGVELLLERAGVLAQLRAKGFRSLHVELDALDSHGQTLRIFCEDGPRELLVEMRAARSRSAVPDMETIALEWLLLQNPREPFSPRVPGCPGSSTRASGCCATSWAG